MKMAMMRDMSQFDTIILKITEMAFDKFTTDRYVEELKRAIDEFIKNDPDVQVLINEMVKEAFKSVDLLSLITESVRKKVQQVMDESQPKENNSEKKLL